MKSNHWVPINVRNGICASDTHVKVRFVGIRRSVQVRNERRSSPSGKKCTRSGECKSECELDVFKHN